MRCTFDSIKLMCSSIQVFIITSHILELLPMLAGKSLQKIQLDITS